VYYGFIPFLSHVNYIIKKLSFRQVWWLMLVILATQEAEIRRIVVGAILGKKLVRPSSTNKLGVVAAVYEAYVRGSQLQAGLGKSRRPYLKTIIEAKNSWGHGSHGRVLI
jgi:hypothetical protein